MPGQRPGMSPQILEADSPHGQDRFRPDRVGLVATRLPGVPGVQAGQMENIAAQGRNQQQNLDAPRAARAVQIQGKAETQALHVAKPLLDLHALAIDAHHRTRRAVRQVARQQPGLPLPTCVLPAVLAARNPPGDPPVSASLRCLPDAVQANPV